MASIGDTIEKKFNKKSCKTVQRGTAPTHYVMREKAYSWHKRYNKKLNIDKKNKWQKKVDGWKAANYYIMQGERKKWS